MDRSGKKIDEEERAGHARSFEFFGLLADWGVVGSGAAPAVRPAFVIAIRFSLFGPSSTTTFIVR